MTLLFEGVAVPFNVPTVEPRPIGVRPGAFHQPGRVQAWLNHEPVLLADTRAGTLAVEATGEGLTFWMVVCELAPARRLLADVRAGRLNGVSIQWDPGSARWASAGRVSWLLGANLIEISLLTGDVQPRFPGTRATLKGVSHCERVRRGTAPVGSVART